MTIAKTTARAQYAGNGSSTAFAFAYRFFADADLEVYISVDATGVETLQTLTTDYTVSNNGDETGGTVTMLTAPASGETLTILRAVAQTQSTDYAANDAFPAETHEAALDRLTLLVQQLQEKIDRSLGTSVSENVGYELPADRASQFLAFDASSVPIAAAGTTGTSDIIVSAFMETVLDDATAEDARTTLGAAGAAELIDEENARTAVLTTGAADAYTLTAASTITAYAAGQLFLVRIHALNTGPSTMNVDGLGAKDVQKYNNSGALVAVAAGDLVLGETHTLGYDGTRFVLLSSTRATTSMPGTVEKSTSDENITGTSDTVYPSVAGVKQIVDVHGTVLQIVGVQDGVVATGTTVIPYDDTIPQITEGDEYMTLAITPESASSTLYIDVTWNGGLSGAGTEDLTVALFVDSTADALAAVGVENSVTGPRSVRFTHSVASGSTSARTYKVRAGGTGSPTVTFNGESSGRKYGGVMASSIIIREVQ